MNAIQHQAARHRENFPVASWLLPRAARADLLALYDFLRGADDIADDGQVPADERYQALLALRQALAENAAALPRWAEGYQALVRDGRLPADYGNALLDAFVQDTQQHRYASYEQLMGYCRLSAMPVGRALLHLCGEHQADRASSDALCAALQLLNHLQDIGSDYRALDRIYLPQHWMAEAGVSEHDLDASHASAGVRRVMHRLLDQIERLLHQARDLAPSVRSWRVRTEVRMIHALAWRLLAQLRVHDPLAQRVRVGKGGWLAALLVAVCPVLPVHSRSHFFWPMVLLPACKRRAMVALYGFCRAVDDIADDPHRSAEQKQQELAQWQQEVSAFSEGQPCHPLLQALASSDQAMALPPDDLFAILEGMQQDVAGICCPTLAALHHYCECVAGRVGTLAIILFGCRDPQSREYALALGQGLQRINILRDVVTDAALGRIYLPQEWLAQHQLGQLQPEAVSYHLEALAPVLQQVARSAMDYLQQANQLLPEADARALRPARQMQRIYQTLLEQMIADGFRYRHVYAVSFWGKVRAVMNF